MELLEILGIVQLFLLLLFLLLFAVIVRVMATIYTQIKPLLKTLKTPGGGVTRLSMGQVASMAMAKAVEAIDFRKILGPLAK